MNILVAPDSFKESLTAAEATEHIIAGIKRTDKSINTTGLPMADGGEGTVQAMVAATNGTLHTADVQDPLMRSINSVFGILGDGNTAVIEMAEASGLERLSLSELNPLVTTTYGTGELIKSALDKGCSKLIIAIGGSATNDGGAGMAQALGINLLDKSGQQISPGGAYLHNLYRIEMISLDHRIKNCEIVVACDVTNPFIGEAGATQVYAKQKGATPAMIEELEINMNHFIEVVENALGISVANTPGAGAAGGLGGGLMAFLNAKLKPGFDIVSGEANLEEHIKWSDLVITGEGMVDKQTQYGKTPFGVAQVARKHQKPVICFAGSIGPGAEELYNHGINAIFSLVNAPMNLDEAKLNAGVLLEQLAENTIRSILSRRLQ